MKILVVSDNHGSTKNLFDLINRVKPFDLLIHCGDIEISTDVLREKAGCEVYAVRGNNDIFFYYDLPKELIIDAGKDRILITHGNEYYVNYSMEYLIEEAKKKGANIVTFGHTHVPFNKEIDGIKLFNPGSIAHPRQEGRRCTYGFINIDIRTKGRAECSICYFE